MSRVACKPANGRTRKARTSYTTEIVADRMQMLGSRSSGGGNSFEVVDKPARSAVAAREAGAKSGGDFDNFEDDIPF